MLSTAAASCSGVIGGREGAVESMPPTPAKSLLSEALNGSQCLACSPHRLIDVFFRVSRRDKRRLELAARQIDAAIHHGPEEAPEALRVTLLCRVVIRH